MKNLSVYAVLLSLGLFVIGCAPPKPVDKPATTEAPPADAPKSDMPKEEGAPAAEGAAATPEKPAEPAAEPAK
jgi:hypothetical protein